jgi:hypothetical protein
MLRLFILCWKTQNPFGVRASPEKFGEWMVTHSRPASGMSSVIVSKLYSPMFNNRTPVAPESLGDLRESSFLESV